MTEHAILPEPDAGEDLIALHCWRRRLDQRLRLLRLRIEHDTLFVGNDEVDQLSEELMRFNRLCHALSRRRRP
jgi:hypothetical protein